jgi:type II secretory ATPase GspE/PulE/Tfp pilus assembly ATPase PilB-like protein
MAVSQKITQKITIPQEIVESLKEKLTGLGSFRSEIEKIVADANATVTQIVETILAGAIALDASDVHLEGQENDAKLRVRLDGVLQDTMVFSRKTYDSLLSRIKLLSEMKLNISNKPQDGRFSILAGSDSVEIRASVLPTEYGD